MKSFHLRTHTSDENLARSGQLAWALAELAADPVEVDAEVADMVVNRIIDDAAVAAASLTRPPVVAARAQALAHPVSIGGAGSTLYGPVAGRRVSVEWAAWANGVAVRELDFHDTFLAADYSHPGDTIPPVVAVAQHAAARGLSGRDVLRAVATAYEVQIDLTRAIDLHSHRIDHVAHLAPAVAAGLGTLLSLERSVTFQAVGQALHTATATRQSRKGEISSWKAYAPAFAGKAAVEAVDRAMRGQGSPSPIWEGEDGVIAWLLDGKDGSYDVPLPDAGEPKRAILDSYTKEHSAEYQAQALIDLGRRMHAQYPLLFDDPANVERVVIRTSDHTHRVIGSGSNDPQKYDPTASRETLDHSVPYIFTVALQDGVWDHTTSYLPERASRPDTVALWRKTTTEEDSEWTRRYHAEDPADRAFGGRVEVTLSDGSVVAEEIAVADAHPSGARPFGRDDYIRKFRTLAQYVIDDAEQDRFLDTVQRLPQLGSDELGGLTFAASIGVLASAESPAGLF